ncbi:MAG: response regulator [Deltaproteobacteria bacterium]|nr:MAG: response regulator [Deltaproteobacteria bacterium]
MYRILIVEDDEHQQMLYKEELESEGYEVELAGDGEVAIRKVEDEDYHLIILDIRMPRMDGIESLGKILDKKGNVPVILHTAYSSYKDSFMSWAADAYVVKSSNLDELKSKVRELLEGKK